MTFTVTRTNRAAAVHHHDRPDLDMDEQRRTALSNRYQQRHKLLMEDHETSMASSRRHHEFLCLMLNEVQHYHRRAFGVRIPTRALQLVAQRQAATMGKGAEDNYFECLEYLRSQRLYLPGLMEAAVGALKSFDI